MYVIFLGGNRRRVNLRDVDWEDHHDLRRRLHQRGKSIKFTYYFLDSEKFGSTTKPSPALQ